MDKEILRVEDVRIGFEREKRTPFTGREKKEVLRGVTFSMREGEVLGWWANPAAANPPCPKWCWDWKSRMEER